MYCKHASDTERDLAEQVREFYEIAAPYHITTLLASDKKLSPL